jgi:hypothetical protein
MEKKKKNPKFFFLKIKSYLLYKKLYLKPLLPKKQNHIEKFPQTQKVQDRE